MNTEDILEKLGTSQEIIQFATTPGRLFILVAQLQFALRHPDNTGGSTVIAREMADNLARAICKHVPEAHELIEAGWQPAYDITRQYFDLEFISEGDRPIR